MDDRLGEIEKFDAVLLRVAAEQVKGLLVVDCVGCHEDAFGAFDHGAAGEGAFEVVVFGEATQDDVERRLELGGVVVGVCARRCRVWPLR